MTPELKQKLDDLLTTAVNEKEHGLAGIIKAYQICKSVNMDAHLVIQVEPLIRKIAIASGHPKFTSNE